jgi:arylsulfatase A-like enzyme
MRGPLVRRRWFLHLIQFLGVIALVLLAVAGFFALRATYRVLTYEQVDDSEHLQKKQEYLATIATSSSKRPSERPNILLILFDDLGHRDLGVYGAESIETPHIDRLAAEGLRLDNYYSPSNVCTSSRAAMLTGRYAPRAGLNIVAFPKGHPLSTAMKAVGVNIRLPAEEILLPEILEAAGYRTGMVGKWHLGDESPSLPRDRGFDSYFGALYSNDMTPFALYRDDEIAHEAPFDQTQLNEVYTRAALDFLEVENDAPFFLYYAHSFPHIPLFTPDSDRGRSRGGLYGDVVEGLDDSVGALLDALEARGDLANTLVILTSDNGPWYEGDPGNARGRKNQTWEGGMRVPFIARWPARIQSARTSDAPVVGVDLLPTLLSLLAMPTPDDRLLDGIDISDFLLGQGEVGERYVYYFSTEADLDAVRDGRFKYHRRRGVRAGGAGDFVDYKAPWGPWLFDLELDPTESYDTRRLHVEDFERLARVFEAKQREMEENLRGWR